MDFVSVLPLRPINKDSIWVIVDRLTKSAHFLLVGRDYFLQRWEDHLTLIEFVYNNSFQASIQMVPYEALYGRKCITPFVLDRIKKKSYVALKRKDIEYSVGDQVCLKVSPWRKVLSFCRKGKLSPSFIGLYQIIKRVAPVAYQLELPTEVDRIHDVFHVSMLRCYRSDPSHIVPIKEIEIQPNLSFEEEPVKILQRDVKVLRRKQIPLVKVLWRNHGVEEVTWESEDSFRQE
ncbi:reverse transcriptase [Gossypium australe]|uniref:Reverse transcriptase n=1 Tax=Gossypium australe TaxID=47621 RepID=A0A5B6WVG6_9ROSI|nr:reverse transcriptase [Gossypium australe]